MNNNILFYIILGEIKKIHKKLTLSSTTFVKLLETITNPKFQLFAFINDSVQFY